MKNHSESAVAAPLISVIVPVYNVMGYLEACVSSIRQQTYENLEILLVNDGSTDDSEAVCQRLLNEDPRIRYYKKDNSGLSDTRNMGIDHAEGEYLLFVDSDDTIESSMIRHLYELLHAGNARIACCEIAHFTDGEPVAYSASTATRVFNTEEALCSFLYQKEISTSACGKLYRRDVFEDLRFMSGILFEDNEFLYQAIAGSAAVVYSNARFYGYRHRKNSITTKKFTARDLDILEIGKRIIRYFEHGSPAVIQAVMAYQCSNCFRIYLTAPCDPAFNEAVDYCRAFLDQHCSAVLRDRNIRRKLYAALLLYRLHIPRKAFVALHRKVERWK